MSSSIRTDGLTVTQFILFWTTTGYKHFSNRKLKTKMVPQLEINSKITVQINKGLKNGFTLVTQMHTQETRYITCSEGQREILYPFQKKKNTRIFISFKHWELAQRPSSSRFNITIFPIRQVHPILTLLYFQFVSQPT